MVLKTNYKNNENSCSFKQISIYLKNQFHRLKKNLFKRKCYAYK